MNDHDRLRKDYELLGIASSATPGEVRRAYLSAIKKVHPDRFPAGSEEQWEAAQKTRELNEAYARIEHAPLRLFTRRSPGDSGGTALRHDGDFDRSSGGVVERAGRILTAVGFTTGKTRMLAYLYLMTAGVNSLLTLATLGWPWFDPAENFGTPSPLTIFSAAGFPLHSLDVWDRLRKPAETSSESMLADAFELLSSVVFLAYPFLCTFMGFLYLGSGRMPIAVWFWASAIVAWALQRTLRSAR